MTKWADLKVGWQVRVKGANWEVLEVTGDSVTLRHPTHGTKTAPMPRGTVEVVVNDAGEQFLTPHEKRRIQQERKRTGLLEEPRADVSDTQIVELARATETDPHDVALALLQIRLGGFIVGEKGQDGWHCEKSFGLLPPFRVHLFMFHGIYTEDVKTLKELKECHDTSHERPHPAHILHNHR